MLSNKCSLATCSLIGRHMNTAVMHKIMAVMAFGLLQKMNVIQFIVCGGANVGTIALGY